jgi:hypothetical protein
LPSGVCPKLEECTKLAGSKTPPWLMFRAVRACNGGSKRLARTLIVCKTIAMGQSENVAYSPGVSIQPGSIALTLLRCGVSSTAIEIIN